MKNNAIVRIVIWSLVIVVLVAVLCAGLGLTRYRAYREYNAEPLILASDTASTSLPAATATVRESVNLRSTPSSDSGSCGTLNAGDTVELTRVENIGGGLWGYVEEPVRGWLDLSYVELMQANTVDPTAATGTAVAAAAITQPVNVRSTPSLDGKCIWTLNKGDTVSVLRSENLDGTTWCYIEEPVEGWFVLGDAQVEYNIAEPADPNATGTLKIDGASVQDLKIVWPLGSVSIIPREGTRITARAYAPDGFKQDVLVWSVDGSKLTLRDSRFPKNDLLGITLHNFHTMNLEILVPSDWEGRDLKIETASASIYLQEQTFREAELDSASSQVNFSDCRLGKLDVDTASGDITFTGSLEELDFDAASADFRGELTNHPKSIDMDSASGSLDLTLPHDCGFSVKLDSMSGRFSSDFDTELRGKRYVCGDGACEIDVDAMSGDVKIRMTPGVAETKPTEPVCTDPTCTDPEHGHETECTVPGCTDASHHHEGHQEGHR